MAGIVAVAQGAICVPVSGNVDAAGDPVIFRLAAAPLLTPIEVALCRRKGLTRQLIKREGHRSRRTDVMV